MATIMGPYTDETPASELIGVQFSLLSSKELLQLSVYENGQSLERAKDLCDPRLGLPAHTGKCYTCNAETTDQCEGHFGHIVLPFCVYNPFLIRHVARILQRLCLNCYKLKKKQIRSRLEIGSEQKRGKGQIVKAGASPCSTSKKRKLSSAENDLQDEESANKNYNVKVTRRRPRGRPRKLSNASMLKRHNADSLENKENNDTSDVVNISSDDGSTDDCKPHTKHSRKVSPDLVDKYRVQARRSLFPEPCEVKSSLDAKNVLRSTSNEDCKEDLFTDDDGACKYCMIHSQGFAEPYPPLLVKVITKVVANIPIEVIEMEVGKVGTGIKVRDIPPDFWGFLRRDLEVQQKTRALLPMEAFDILRKIPIEMFNSLGSKKFLIRPEDCFIKVLPVPPNCLRIIEQSWNDKVSARLGCDSSTRALATVVNKVRALKIAIDEKQFFHMAENDAWELQALVVRYFRTNLLVDEEECRDSRKPGTGVGLKWFRKTVLGKRSSHSSRAVISGDPYISLHEIAIPYKVAQTLTTPEVANRFNCSKLEKYVRSRGKNVKMDAITVIRDGQKFNLTGNEKKWSLKFGDIVHRKLKDGDLVFVNRTPTVHKHSLIAFHVKIHHKNTLAINPIMCAPFSADFDGDEMHVYVPQSTETVAELLELMTVPQQMICSQGGQPIIKLTQDSLLAAHSVTTNHLFLSKYEMDQLRMWCTASLPIPAIIKSPYGRGPLWTGKQLFSMSLPRKIAYASTNKGVIISDGELLVCDGSACLQRSPDSLLYQLSTREGPILALQHLNQAQSILHEWLCLQGFSIGLSDFYLAKDSYSRSKLLGEVKYGLEEAKRAFTKQHFLSDADVQRNLVCGNIKKFGATASPLQAEIRVRLDPKDCRSLEKIKNLQPFAMDGFQKVFNDLERVVMRHISGSNSLLKMVKAGSKGSVAKIVHQSGCLGVQPYRGEEWLLLQQHKQLKNYSVLMGAKANTPYQTEIKEKVPPFTPAQYWRFKGLVENSFLDGLSPHNFFIHSITSRGAGICDSIKGPGQLFRRLMNLLQDVYVSYDGTVRNMYGDCIVQFEYGGTRAQYEDSDIESVTTSSVKGSADILSNELAGEAVGALAASAVAEPAYNVVLDSPHQVGMRKVQPLTLLQETLLTRRSSKIKLNDRCVILRLSRDACKGPQGQEWGVLKVFEHLKPITLEQVTSRTIIEYQKLGDCGVKFMQESPWVGRFELQKESLRRCNLTLTSVTQELKEKFHLAAGVSGQKNFHQLIFISSDQCQPFTTFTRDPCIYFFPDLPQISKSEDDSCHEERTSYLLDTMRDVMLPILLKTVIKGDPCIESVSIFWEESPHKSIICDTPLLQNLSNGNNDLTQSPGELVLKVHVKDIADRGLAWRMVQRACLPIMNILDWQRCIPYSVQEVLHSFGIEAARSCILERLKVAVRGMGKPIYAKHLILISDTMTHSGNVTGFTPAGYKELLDSVSISAPFTRGSCMAPRRTFLNSALEKASDNLQGVIATSAFGKLAHLGTGSNFKIMWQEDRGIGLYLSKYHSSNLSFRKRPSHFYKKAHCHKLLEGKLNNSSQHNEDRRLGLHDGVVSTECHRKPSYQLEQASEESWKMIKLLVERTQMILHNSKYKDGDLLEQPDQRTILKEVLHHHPDSHLKIGSGVQSIKVDYHHKYGCRCFFINYLDGSSNDFSYHKCLRELSRKKDFRLGKRYDVVYFRTSK